MINELTALRGQGNNGLRIGINKLEMLEKVLRHCGVTANDQKIDRRVEETGERVMVYDHYSDGLTPEIELYWSLEQGQGKVTVEFGVCFCDGPDHGLASTLYVTYSVDDDVWSCGYQVDGENDSPRGRGVAIFGFGLADGEAKAVSEKQAVRNVAMLARGYVKYATLDKVLQTSSDSR